MSALTIKCSPDKVGWLTESLCEIRSNSETLDFAISESGLFHVVAVYHELQSVTALVNGHAGVFVLDYESSAERGFFDE